MGWRVGQRQGVKWRAVASLSASWMFLVTGVTGLVLYVVPQGRIAYWVDWRFLALTKTDWGNVHIVAAVLFLVAGGWHLYFNWRAFLGHLRRKLTGGFAVRRELAATTFGAVFVVVAALWQLPPLGYLIDLNEFIKDSWIESADYEPPFGHAELLSLERLCQKTGIDIERARAELNQRGFVVTSTAQTLEQIARQKGVPPKDVFAIIERFQTKRGARQGRAGKSDSRTADGVFERFEGKRLGRKRLDEACEIGGEDTERCLGRLRARGVEADPDERIKAVAARAGMRPIQLLQVMLVEEE